MKRIAMGVVAAAAIFVNPAMAGSEFPYTLGMHFLPPSYVGCNEPAAADAALNCTTLDPNAIDVGAFAPNFLWLVVTGVPAGTGAGAPGGIGGIQFGIEYDPTVVLGGPFTLCTGGSAIPQDDLDGTWPASGTGNALTFGGGCKLVTDNPDGVTKLGFIPINPGSSGLIRFIEDPRIGEAQAAGCDASIARICRQSMGIGDVTIGGGRGENKCGFLCPVPVQDASWGSIKSIYGN
jgi:hypothetical protein